jgi:16S rRNA (cytosine967-C5)-methyltransferase
MGNPRVTPSRLAALNIMRAIRSGELADRAFARLAVRLDARDRAWVHELVYGALRLRGRLDFVLDRFVKRGTASLDDDVLDILRLGVYQLLEMRSVPAHAAVSQSVELTKSVRERSASGLVNGVLQSVGRARAGLAPETQESVEFLSHWGSHPRWLIERWIERFGEAAAARIVDANNQRPELYIRPVGISVQAAIVRAEAAGITLQSMESAPDALQVVDGRIDDVLAKLPAIVQDPAAGLVARYAAPEGGVIADVCAAPGGKAIALADQVDARGVVIASDIAASRLGRAIENAHRIGGLPLHFLAADARMPAIAHADLVMLDAPCTGTGTFRRHPDGKWRVTSHTLRALVLLQRELLDAVADVVKIGGILVYATCSLEAEENQEQVAAFLDRHTNFLRRPPSPWHGPELINEIGDLVVLPHERGFDGSFAARLERVA